uniref:Putative secreted protein n=1 Tax=Anopheles darlingi TaxID=43151 RepID=A0A2M4D3Y0_ANODA
MRGSFGLPFSAVFTAAPVVAAASTTQKVFLRHLFFLAFRGISVLLRAISAHVHTGGQTQQTHTRYTHCSTHKYTHTRARKTDVLKYIRMLGHPVFGVGSDGTEHTELER